MKVMFKGEMIDRDYEDICRDLGFVADVHFVKVTRSGKISFTIGKEREILALLAACYPNGYEPGTALRRYVYKYDIRVNIPKSYADYVEECKAYHEYCIRLGMPETGEY